MMNKKVKSLVLLGILATSVAGLAPMTVNAASWNNNYGYASMPSQGKWQYQNGNWYFIANGTQATGWKHIDGKWYLFDTNGVMQKGWKYTGGQWYFLDKSGAMVTGWLKYGNNWYFLKSDGARLGGWLLDKGKWYYMDPTTGMMLTNWITLGDKHYFLKSDGSMGTGWIKQSGYWYYLQPNGAMYNPSRDGSVLQIGNKYHKFYAGGRWMCECQDSTGTSYTETIKQSSPTIKANSFSMHVGEGYNTDNFEAVAKDYTGKNITDKIEYIGVVNTLVRGNYTIRLRVTDDYGATSEKFCIVYVKDK